MTVSARTSARRERAPTLAAFVARRASLIWLIILASATLWVYASSLNYPFFWVDPIDIGLARDRSVLQIFTTSQGYLYYRPFAFVLWKLLAAAQGEYNPFGFHLVHILTHVSNVWLMFALAKRLLRQAFAAGIAALFFAWYPFSHQTVTWVISPQLQAMLFMLLSAILYYDGRVTNRRKLIWLSVLMLALALPFHENAVSFGFVIAALEVLVISHSAPPLLKSGGGQEWRSRVSWYPLLHIGLCLAFAALWFVIPKDPDSAIARFDQASGWYLLQGLIWPVAGAIGPWRVWFAALSNPAWAPLIIAAPITSLLLFGAYWRGRRLRLFWFGMIWFGAMVLPIWATRGFAYVGTSPRILYVAAGGAALIWAGLLTLDFRSARINRWWRIAVIGVVAATLAQGVVFLYTRKTLDDQTMPAIWDVIDSGQQAGSAARLLYINAPDQITPKWREFPVGFFRAVLMPVSVDLGQYTELQKGVRPQTQSLSVTSLAHLEDFPYNVDLRGEAVDQARLSAAIRNAKQVFIAEYDPAGIVKIVEAGGQATQHSTQPIATFDGRLQLAGAMLDSNQQRLTLIWNCLAPLNSDETIFVHVLDANGQLVTQADGAPVHGLFPLNECQPGEIIRDVRDVGLPAGTFTIKTGVYNRATQERLEAVDVNANKLADDAAIVGQTP